MVGGICGAKVGLRDLGGKLKCVRLRGALIALQVRANPPLVALQVRESPPQVALQVRVSPPLVRYGWA